MLLQRVLRVYSEPVLNVVKLGEDIAHAQTLVLLASYCCIMAQHGIQNLCAYRSACARAVIVIIAILSAVY
eukprot:2006-Heterococcus_DN1.PRE.1